MINYVIEDFFKSFSKPDYAYFLLFIKDWNNNNDEVTVYPPHSQPRYDSLPDDILRLIAEKQYDYVIAEFREILYYFEEDVAYEIHEDNRCRY
jgi:hypothetical protein